MGCKIIAFTGSQNSTLANFSDIVIDVAVDREACPLGLAPTASTTALLAMGDALAVVLLEKKQWCRLRICNDDDARMRNRFFGLVLMLNGADRFTDIPAK